MTEQELQQYLLSNYTKENEGCEWKEFKNLKNDFNGKEKDDGKKPCGPLWEFLTNKSEQISFK